MPVEDLNKMSEIIGKAIQVYREPGTGLLGFVITLRSPRPLR